MSANRSFASASTPALARHAKASTRDATTIPGQADDRPRNATFAPAFDRMAIHPTVSPGPPKADPVHRGAVPSSDLLRNASVPTTTGGAPLRREIRTREEGRLGIDLAAVRVHHGPRAARLADELGARAFVFGGHVFASALVT